MSRASSGGGPPRGPRSTSAISWTSSSAPETAVPSIGSPPRGGAGRRRVAPCAIRRRWTIVRQSAARCPYEPTPRATNLAASDTISACTPPTDRPTTATRSSGSSRFNTGATPGATPTSSRWCGSTGSCSCTTSTRNRASRRSSSTFETMGVATIRIGSSTGGPLARTWLPSSRRLESRRLEGSGWRRAGLGAGPAVVEAALGIAAALDQRAA